MDKDGLLLGVIRGGSVKEVVEEVGNGGGRENKGMVLGLEVGLRL